MIGLTRSILGLSGISFIVSLINLLSRHYLSDKEPEHKPLVSVLIPARNEEDSIGIILEDLAGLSYEYLEILVYDDDSNDDTRQVVQAFQEKDSRIRLLSGKDLPEGFTGKNHACHQLSLSARGDFFLFLDADVRVKGALVEKALYWMIKNDLALLSIFPVQLMQSFGEKISVPLMNWILLSLLPLPLIRLSSRSSLSAANGQFMMIPAGVYKKYLLHQRFKSHKVEDVAIIRFLKQKGAPVDTLLGKENISCRMYNNLGEAIDGFSKNIFLFFGNSITLTVLYALLITIAPVMVIYYLPLSAWIAYFLLILLMRINVSLASRQAVFQNLLFLIPQHFIFLAIIAKAIYNRVTNKLIWKGRNVLDL